MLLASLVGLLVIATFAYRTPATDDSSAGMRGAFARHLASRWIVAAVGIATIAIVWWAWGSLHPVAVVQDEFAYVLQARIFASGHWTAPSPPMPEFFEQAHVLVVPALAAKYPPGHSLLLAIGALVGYLPLVPLLLAGVTGSMLFVLARRYANGAVALVAWMFWLSSPMVQRFAPGFYSESTTAACWLGGWLALLEWRATGRRTWLLVLALIIGLGAITRPLTMLVYAVPVGIVVVRDVVRTRRWRDLALAMLAGVAVLAVLPLWSARTTGQWNVSPVSLYTRQYMPWDVPGFGFNATPPSRPIPDDLAALTQRFEPMHRLHLPETMVEIFEMRFGFLLRNTWGAPWALMLPLALVGLVAAGPATLLALASSLLLFVAYMCYAAAPAWTLYYYEVVPVLAYFTAAGAGVLGSLVARGADWRSRARGWRRDALAPALLAGGVLLAVPGLRSLHFARQTRRAEVLYRHEFARILAALPQHPAVLFVRYAPDHNPHTSLVRNSPDLASDPVWVVYDRGPAENARLLALVPTRATYVYDEAHRGIFPYDIREALAAVAAR